MELQTLLRRTREASGETQVFIQEQYRFLQQQQPSRPGDVSTPAPGGAPVRHAVPSVIRAGRGLENGSPMGAGRGGYLQDWPGPVPPSSVSSDSFAASLIAEDRGFGHLRPLSSDYYESSSTA